MNGPTKPAHMAADLACVLIAEILRSFIERPDQVTIEVIGIEEAETVIFVVVPSEDFERLMEQGGRVLRALRTFVSAVAAKNGLRIRLQVEAKRPPPPSAPQSDFESPSHRAQSRRSDNSDDNTSRF